ncbi:hypothetical protein Ocin01_06522 [Orchesella cincta]|uniref:Uncharacterized protein n=1 Tax=Orchesella cincta TaxID=48709 RepID=A0A1D2N4F0_ORCCI|nr:hypothetical protein Ocin01_06522 [Orchesella cincta]
MNSDVMATHSGGGSLANLVATIDSVAAGSEPTHDHDDHGDVVTAEMLEGTVLHLSDGQSINVVEMPGSLEDTINVVQVETTELEEHEHDGHQHVATVEEICGMDIDSAEQNHILSETGAHVVVKTEEDPVEQGVQEKLAASLPTMPQIPFSFPGQTFDTKCQKLILNVWDFFRRVKKNPDLLDEIRTPQERAAAALHISAATIGKIGKNFKRTGKLETPGKKRQRTKPVVDSVNSDHEDTIRKIIKEFKDNRITPTLPLILNECRERINFQGGATSFRRILQRMGFKGLTTKTVPPSPSSKSKLLNSTSSSASTSKATTYLSAVSDAKNLQKKEHFISLPISSPTASPTKRLTFRPVVPPSPSSTTSVVPTRQISTQSVSKQTSRVMGNFLGGNLLQLGTNGKGEPIRISQETAAAIASATARLACEGPQTLHVLQADNTVQQIQVVYANMS